MNPVKKAILLVVVIAAAVTKNFAQNAPAFAADKDPVLIYGRPNVFKTNLAGPFSLFYERQIQPRQSIQLSVNRANWNFLWDDSKYSSISAAYKFYLSTKQGTERRPVPSGFYVSPYIKYVNVRETGRGFFSGLKTSELSYNLFGGGVVAGYQVIFRRGLTLDFFLGGGYLPANSYKIIYTYSSTYIPEANADDFKADVRVGICVGYAFR